MIVCKKFKTHKSGKLIGFADLYVEKWKATLHGCGLYQQNGKRWVGFPTRIYEDELGEKKYAILITFDEKKLNTLFSEEAKKAIDKWCRENQKSE